MEPLRDAAAVGSSALHRHDAGVGVDYFWRRVPRDDVEGLDAAELYDVVPYWFDEPFERENDAGITVVFAASRASTSSRSAASR